MSIYWTITNILFANVWFNFSRSISKNAEIPYRKLYDNIVFKTFKLSLFCEDVLIKSCEGLQDLSNVITIWAKGHYGIYNSVAHFIRFSFQYIVKGRIWGNISTWRAVKQNRRLKTLNTAEIFRDITCLVQVNMTLSSIGTRITVGVVGWRSVVGSIWWRFNMNARFFSDTLINIKPMN